ncbi:phage tail protein [Pantoea sp. y20]
MTTKYYAILTSAGAAKLANAAALGMQVKITKMAVGDGNGVLPVPDPARTALVREVRRAVLNSLSVDPDNTNQIIAEQVIPESEGGWFIREIGLYDDTDTLIAVANCPETYKPLLAEGSGRTQTVRMIIIVSSTESVTLKIDPSVVLATRMYVDNAVLIVRQYADSLMNSHNAAADPHKQYAPKESPLFSGIPKAPTAAAGNNSTQLANTAFVQAALAALAGTAPEALDTLKELADALGNDPHFSATVIDALSKKMDIAKNGADIADVAAFLANIGMGSAAKRDAGTGDKQLPDMSAFGFSRNGQNGWSILPNGMIRQFGTVTLSPAGNFNKQTLGGVDYYTHYYRIAFPRQYPGAQVATLATLASPAYTTQGSMAGRSLAVHRDTDTGSDVSKARFTLAYTTTILGEAPTIHFDSTGY